MAAGEVNTALGGQWGRSMPGEAGPRGEGRGRRRWRQAEVAPAHTPTHTHTHTHSQSCMLATSSKTNSMHMCNHAYILNLLQLLHVTHVYMQQCP